MADYDSALPIRGNVLDGDSTYAENTLLVIAGTDVPNNKYEALLVDSGGRPRVVGAASDGASPVSDPVLVSGLFETSGGNAVLTGQLTRFALDAYGRVICVGQVADGGDYITNAFPVVMAGVDDSTPTAKVQALLTDTAGRLQVVVGGGTKSGWSQDDVNLVKDTATTILTVPAADKIKRLYASGSGLMKVEVKVGVALSEVLMATKFNSTANPNVDFEFAEDGFEVPAGEQLIVVGTNLENRASPNSDFTGYATCITEVDTA